MRERGGGGVMARERKGIRERGTEIDGGGSSR